MALTEKYQPLIDIANQSGVGNLQVSEENDLLPRSGTAPSEEVKQRLWDEYNRLDPDMRSGDLVLNIEVGGGEDFYTVQRGDTLSEIGSGHGVNWGAIHEAHRDQPMEHHQILPGLL